MRTCNKKGNKNFKFDWFCDFLKTGTLFEFSQEDILKNWVIVYDTRIFKCVQRCPGVPLLTVPYYPSHALWAFGNLF